MNKFYSLLVCLFFPFPAFFPSTRLKWQFFRRMPVFDIIYCIYHILLYLLRPYSSQSKHTKKSTKSKMIAAATKCSSEKIERERGYSFTSQSEWEKVELRECKTGILYIIRRPIQIQQPFIYIIWIMDTIKRAIYLSSFFIHL